MRALVIVLAVLLLALDLVASFHEDHHDLGSGERVAEVGVAKTPPPNPYAATVDLGPSFLKLIGAAKPAPRPRQVRLRAPQEARRAIPDLIRSVFSRFGPAVAEQAVRVSSCETGGTFDPSVVNASGHAGLFQLSVRYHQARAARLGFSWAQMRQALPNITVAADLYGETRSWQAWTCKP